MPVKSPCHYCDCQATCWLVWLKDRQGLPKRVRLPYCGYCDLMTALKKFWPSPDPITKGTDYVVEEMVACR